MLSFILFYLESNLEQEDLETANDWDYEDFDDPMSGVEEQFFEGSPQSNIWRSTTSSSSSDNSNDIDDDSSNDSSNDENNSSSSDYTTDDDDVPVEVEIPAYATTDFTQRSVEFYTTAKDLGLGRNQIDGVIGWINNFIMDPEFGKVFFYDNVRLLWVCRIYLCS